MTFFTKPTILAAAFGAALLISGQAQAQSTQQMDLLTLTERQAFNHRLQHSSASSERAKITAEMNLLVRERSLAKRRADRAAEKKQAANKTSE